MTKRERERSLGKVMSIGESYAIYNWETETKDGNIY